MERREGQGGERERKGRGERERRERGEKERKGRGDGGERRERIGSMKGEGIVQCLLLHLCTFCVVGCQVGG